MIAGSLSLSGTWDSFSLLFMPRVAMPLACPTPAIFALVTELSASLVVVTELSVSFGVVTALSVRVEVVTTPCLRVPVSV